MTYKTVLHVPQLKGFATHFSTNGHDHQETCRNIALGLHVLAEEVVAILISRRC